MPLNARYLLTLPVFVLAAALLLNSKGRDHMTSLLQFGKSLFSARQTTMENAAATPSFFDRKFTDIKGQPMNMEELRGKVLLMVNTASECGYTPQLHTLQELQDKYKERGFSVLVRVFPLLVSHAQSPADDSLHLLGKRDSISAFARVYRAITSASKSLVTNLKSARCTRANSRRRSL